MSAVTKNEYTGNNSTTEYSFTFPYLKTSDIKASLDGVVTTAFTLPSATTLKFNTAPGQGVKIRIFRETSVDDLTATFYAGSAIKSEDLNDNFTQNLYVTQEVSQRYASNLGFSVDGNISIDGNISVTGTVDGRDLNADGLKLDGIDSGAKDDQTAAEIRALVDSATDSNVFTDADHTKLDGIDAGAKDDQTAAEILTLLSDQDISTTGNITVTGTVDGVDISTRDALFGGLTTTSGELTAGVVGTTQSAGDNSRKIATTAYVDNATSGISSDKLTSPDGTTKVEATNSSVDVTDSLNVKDVIPTLYLQDNNGTNRGWFRGSANGLEINSRVLGSEIKFQTNTNQGTLNKIIIRDPNGNDIPDVYIGQSMTTSDSNNIPNGLNAMFPAAGGVELYHISGSTGTKKFETTANGVTVDGALTAGGLTYPSANGADGQVLTSDGAGNVLWENATGGSGSGSGATRGTFLSTSVSLAAGASSDTSVSSANGANVYALLAIHNIDYPCWIRVYTSTAARTADANRNELTDPLPGSGVLAEIITTSTSSSQSFYFTPAILGFNTASSNSEIYLRITDKRSTGNAVSHQPSLEITKFI